MTLLKLSLGALLFATEPLPQARSFIEAGKLAEAETTLRAYLVTHDDSATAHYLLGYTLFKQQKAEASLAEYTQGAKYRAPSSLDFETIGADYVLLRDYADADKWFTKAVEMNPQNSSALYYLGRTKYNENLFEEAIKTFGLCLKLDPTNVNAEDNLGLSYQGLGQLEEAEAAFRQAIAWQQTKLQKDAGPFLNLGALLIDAARASEALPFLQSAVTIAPQDAAAHRTFGKAYLALNQLEKAQAELEWSARLALDNAPIHFMLAQVYRKRGFADKAKAESDRYTTLVGGHSVPAN